MSNTGQSYGTKAYRNYALTVLTLIYMFSFIDRILINVISSPIIEEFELSNFQFSILSGFAFVLFFTFLTIPIAQYSETHNRVKIIAVCVVLWSIATVLCGFTTGFLGLIFARMLIGIGAAGCAAPSNSLITDYYKVADRPAALGIYAAGMSIGLVIASLGGGLLLKFFTWRETFMIVGIPGIIIGLICWFTLKESPRGYSNQADAPTHTAPRLSDTLKVLARKKSYCLTILGTASVAFGGYALLSYLTLFIQYNYNISAADAAIQYITVITVGSIVGTVSGGVLIKHLMVKNDLAPFWVSALGLILSLPLMLMGIWIHNKFLVIVFFFVASVIQHPYVGAQLFIVQSVASVRMRATSVAILIFVVNIVGFGIGMIVFAVIADMAVAVKLASLEAGARLSINCSLSDFTMTESARNTCRVAKAYGQKISLSLASLFLAIGGMLFILASRHYHQDKVN